MRFWLSMGCDGFRVDMARALQGDSLKIAFAFLLSMPGAPFIYYGDEIGMHYVEKQMKDENSLYHEIKKLIQIRQSHKALQSKGEITFVYAKENTYPLAYLREEGEERILVVINPAAREVCFDCVYKPKETIYSFGREWYGQMVR